MLCLGSEFRRPARARFAAAVGLSAVAALLCLGGCSRQDFGRPISGVISDLAESHSPYVPADSTNRAARTEQLSRALAAWREANPATNQDYTVGPGDVLAVDVLSLEAPGQTSKLTPAVANNGFIDLPYVGAVQAAGMTIQKIQALIRMLYGDRYIKDPQVSVSVSEFHSAPVVLTGAVSKPGVYYLRRNQSSVLEVLADADGLGAEAGDELLVVRSRPSGVHEPEFVTSPAPGSAGPESPAPSQDVIPVDLRQLIDAGNMTLNVPVRGGDIISVPPRLHAYFYVLGYVARPGAFEIARSSSGAVGALHAIAMAGGLLPNARAQNSYLIRHTDEGQKVISVDLTKIARGARPDFEIENGDTLVVGSSTLARLSEFIRPSVGAGVSYAPIVP